MAIEDFIRERALPMATRGIQAPTPENDDEEDTEIKGLDSVIEAIDRVGEILKADKEEKAKEEEKEKAEGEATASVLRQVADHLGQIVPAIVQAMGEAIKLREQQQDAQLKMIYLEVRSLCEEVKAAGARNEQALEDVADLLRAPVELTRSGDGKLHSARRVTKG